MGTLEHAKAKEFRFGNGLTQVSESYVLIPQTHRFSLSVFTLDAPRVPVLIGVRTLDRLKVILDLQRSLIIMCAVDPMMAVPLIRSTSGHLLLDLRDDWMKYCYLLKQPLGVLRRPLGVLRGVEAGGD